MVKFIDSFIKWKRQEEQGNHLHIRPATNDEVSLWYSTAYNTLSLIVLGSNLLSFKTTEPFRDTWRRWAGYPKIFIELLNVLGDILKHGITRFYEAVTFNSGEHRHVNKPLTLEIRLCETHPERAFAFQNLVVALTLKFGRIFDINFDEYRSNFDYVIGENVGFSTPANEVGLTPTERFKRVLRRKRKVMFCDVFRAIKNDLHPIARRVIRRSLREYQKMLN